MGPRGRSEQPPPPFPHCEPLCVGEAAWKVHVKTRVITAAIRVYRRRERGGGGEWSGGTTLTPGVTTLVNAQWSLAAAQLTSRMKVAYRSSWEERPNTPGVRLWKLDVELNELLLCLRGWRVQGMERRKEGEEERRSEDEEGKVYICLHWRECLVPVMMETLANATDPLVQRTPTV